MNREAIALAKQAVEESWDAFKIMAEFSALQKEADARIAESNGSTEIAELIRNQ